MCNNQLNKKFNEHVERLKKELEVNPKVLYGEEAKKYIKNKIGSWYGKNGGYNSEEDIVAVIDTMKIGTLAHEMRHAWQYKNKFYSNFPKSQCILLYLASPKEFDANKYALDYCKRNGLEATKNYIFRIVITYIPVLIYTMFEKFKK